MREGKIDFMNEPLVSVCIITYNHVKFIKQALDGALNQKVDFPWQIIVADDFSTDGTRDILLEYQNLYPSLIKLILQEKNVGPGDNWLELITVPQSKYIAYLEGDDYWIDPTKLQQQVDFLEANDDFSACGHPAYNLSPDGKFSDKLIGKFDDSVFEYADFAKGYKRIPSSSLVFKKIFSKPPELFYSISYGGDRALLFLLSKVGKIKMLDFVGSVYRVHHASQESGYRQDKKRLAQRNIDENMVYLKLVEPKYGVALAKKIRWNYFYLFLMYLREASLMKATSQLPGLLRFQLMAMGLINTGYLSAKRKSA